MWPCRLLKNWTRLGDIIRCVVLLIQNKWTQWLHDQLMELGCQLIKDELVPDTSGEIFPVSQDEQFVTYAKKLINQNLRLTGQSRQQNPHELLGWSWSPGSFVVLGKRLS